MREPLWFVFFRYHGSPRTLKVVGAVQLLFHDGAVERLYKIERLKKKTAVFITYLVETNDRVNIFSLAAAVPY